MPTDFHNSSLVHYNNLVSVAYGTQPMSYNDNGTLGKSLVEGFYDFTFVDGIERVGRFVQKKIGWVTIECASNEQSLFLSTAEPSTGLSDKGVVAF